MQTHFKVAAREMLFDSPERCPVFPVLTFDGIAVDEDDRQHLIFTTPAARFYAGPDEATVRRRAELVAAALRSGKPQLDADVAEVVSWWIETCWEATLDEIVDSLATPIQDL